MAEWTGTQVGTQRNDIQIPSACHCSRGLSLSADPFRVDVLLDATSPKAL